MPLAPIVEATRSYERWLAQRLVVVRPDLDFKHGQMAADPFSFMRATYYRWAQLFHEISKTAEIFSRFERSDPEYH